ncbi:hypothetical protein ACFSKL_23040 [Belliella marina]|uniref:Uncharacterized protein n=1 Tax=Belliella marina TaxID=1644146 RepID=A0ABW4VSK7_9BACT
MKRLNNFFTLGAGVIVLLSSCSTSYNAMQGGESDDLYFMASDARVATEYAVSNNNPNNFQSLNQTTSDQFEQENFSARNVNPEFIAKYQADSNAGDEGSVYFDDNEVVENNPNVNVYNNYYSNAGNNFNSGFGSPFFNPMMMGGFSPWGMGFSPWGMGGFYDPFWGPGFGMMPGFGFRPGFNMSIGMGFGFGNPWMMRRGFGMGMMGMGGFYDPFFDPFFPRFGMMGWGGGFGYGGFGRPIYVIPGGEYNNRQIVRGARPSRGSSLATAGSRSSGVATPSTSRAAARRDATTGSRSLTSTPSTRNARNDFGSSQNDYYNSARSRSGTAARSAAPSSRNVSSPATDRGASRVGTRSAAPSYRNTAPNTRSTVNTAPSRTTSPSYNRSASPSYNSRSTAPSRSTYSAPSRTSTPTRSTPSYSAPSRSSGGSVGGASRGGGGTSSGGSRGGRGN